jgi:hypothetical protein
LNFSTCQSNICPFFYCTALLHCCS